MSGLFCTRRRGTARPVTLRPRPCVPAQHPAGFTGLSGGGRRGRAGTFRGERRAATRGLTCWFHQCAPTKPAKCPNCNVSTSRAPPAIPPLLLGTPLPPRAARPQGAAPAPDWFASTCFPVGLPIRWSPRPLLTPRLFLFWNGGSGRDRLSSRCSLWASDCGWSGQGHGRFSHLLLSLFAQMPLSCS